MQHKGLSHIIGEDIDMYWMFGGYAELVMLAYLSMMDH